MRQVVILHVDEAISGVSLKGLPGYAHYIFALTNDNGEFRAQPGTKAPIGIGHVKSGLDSSTSGICVYS